MKVAAETRYWPKVDKRGREECWLWLGGHLANGYGSFWFNEHNGMAHRFAYELAHGPIQAGLVIDHLCRVRGCVNPSHLEAVTSGENVLRGMSPAVVAHRSGVCKRGHSLADAHRSGGLVRNCRTCRREALEAGRWRRTSSARS